MIRSVLVCPCVLSLCLTILLPTVAPAADPSSEPVLRIEAETHTAPVRQIATDGANRYLVTGSDDKTVRVWELTSGRLLRILRPPVGGGAEGRIYAVAVSPDGATIACGGATGLAWEPAVSIYVFDRDSGRLIRRLAGPPRAHVHQLAWSPDGKLIAAATDVGVSMFRAHDGTPVAVDTGYGARSVSVDFHRSGRLASASWDGLIRLYRANERELTLVQKQPTPGGQVPHSVRFSPDGARIAVGYRDAKRVEVLSGDDLGHLYSADTQGGRGGDVLSVGWSANGRLLYAAGRWFSGGLNTTIRVWSEAGRGAYADLPAATGTIYDVLQLGAGGIAYGSYDTSFGVFDVGGRKTFERRGAISDFRGMGGGLMLSRDGAAVRFAFAANGRSPARFDVRERRMTLEPPGDADLRSAVTTAPGLDLRNWSNVGRPTLNGKPLPLSPDEPSRAVAIAPDQQSFVLGAEWSVRRFDRQGNVLWRVPVPSVTWGVNVSGDGKLVVAAFADGTLRWYRLSDGKELLALFPHADRKTWVLWTLSGHYDASAGGEELIGWHVNRGRDRAADFFPVSRFRSSFYRPDVVANVLKTLDGAAALKLGDEQAGRATRPVQVARVLPPVVEIVSPADGTAVTSADVRVRFRTRTAADAPIVGVRARVNGQAVSARDVVIGQTGEVRELSVPVPPGDSDIMIFAENRHGVSAPAAVRVAWRGGPAASSEAVAKPKLYVVAVGVGQYQDALLRLHYPAKDAQDFARTMAAQHGGLYRDVEIKLLTDAKATRDEVMDGLEWLERQVTAKDVGMLFFAGHGVNDPNGTFYLLPANADVDRLKRTGIPYSDIRNTLSALAGKALFFFDACHAGNVMGKRRAGPPDVTAVVNDLASAEHGVVVLAASTGRQYSLESPEWSNGAFTKAVVEGLMGKADRGHDGRITHKMLDSYVAERVKELTRGRQTPVSYAQGVPDFPIALSPVSPVR